MTDLTSQIVQVFCFLDYR